MSTTDLFSSSREIVCPGFMDPIAIKKMQKRLDQLPKKATDPTVVIRMVDNRGGVVDRGMFHFIHSMKKAKCGVTIISSGTVDSCGALILMSGTKGYRYVSKNSTALIHCPEITLSVALLGKDGVIPKAIFNDLRRASDSFRKIFENCTSFSKPTLNLVFNKGKAMTLNAEHLIEFGLADKISA